jgi:hypothetical protein
MDSSGLPMVVDLDMPERTVSRWMSKCSFSLGLII